MPTQNITRIDTPHGRFYRTPAGTFPSVTTVLGSIPNPAIDEWRARVGEKEARRIANAAAARGTRLHEAVESYYKSGTYQFDPYRIDERKNFERNLLPVLGEIQPILLEQFLYSTKLRTAGTVDCVAVNNNTVKLIDWKTSTRYKLQSEISSYFLQMAAYSVMVYERHGIAVKELEVIMLTEDSGLLRYTEDPRAWIPKFIKIRDQYAEPKIQPDVY